MNDSNSVGIKEPVERATRSGDLRLACGRGNCELQSDTSVIVQLSGKPNGSLESCRAALDGKGTRSQSLDSAASGSEFCVKHQSGDIALLVLAIKSTPWMENLPSFLVADMTVWRVA